MSEENRLTEIETTLAHQDKVIADLSDVMNDQWKEIQSLKRKISETNNKIDELESNSGASDESNVKPPHW
jgi:SlyX protein